MRLRILILAAIAVMTLSVAAPASAGPRPAPPLLRVSLAASLPTDPAIHGVTAGTNPWAIDRGVAVVRERGRVRATVRGLILTEGQFAGTAGPVTSISASVYCGADSTPAVATTPAAPLSLDGDGETVARVTLPDDCLAPTVLVHPNGNTAVYIAAAGR